MTENVRQDDSSLERFDRDALAEDARELVAAIEEIHPDPYVGYDGRVALHARLERLVRELPESATTEEFYRRAAPLVAGLQDAHSLLKAPERTDDGAGDRTLPVEFRVVGDRLYVESVADDALADLVGARLLAVAGESVATLVDRGASLRGAENGYMERYFAAGMIEHHRRLARLLDRPEPPAEPTLRFETADGERSVAMTPVAHDREPTHDLGATFPHPTGSGPRYRLYEGGDAAVFVPGDLQGYRESFEVAMARGATTADELAPAAYERHVGGDPPDDLDAMVAALPSMAETLADLADAMAAADTDTLVVDLRDNPGGDSQFVFHLAYVLAGWDAVADTVAGVRSLKRRTDRHRERYGTGEAGLGTAADSPVDYDFSDFLDDGGGTAERLRDGLTQSDTFARFVEDGSYEGAYAPERIVVAVSTGTLSSGFAGAAQLTSLGAEVVGVPSGQAPKSFGEAVEVTLPNTGLTANVAGAMYHWTPDPDAAVLEPDRELTPAAFEAYDRAGDAGLRLAFDHAGVTDGDPPETVE
ncbi:S41 family peptidase [Halomicrococcus gelatinilyticus]|uniref:S41 family peptidase n=1 Tax=Halomicrococcus gelatinilyticus TaxID=1702103 RepID=UPI002E14B1D2